MIFLINKFVLISQTNGLHVGKAKLGLFNKKSLHNQCICSHESTYPNWELSQQNKNIYQAFH